MIAFLTFQQAFATLLTPEFLRTYTAWTIGFIRLVIAIVDSIALSPGWDTIPIIASKIQRRVAGTVLFIASVRTFANIITFSIPM